MAKLGITLFAGGRPMDVYERYLHATAQLEGARQLAAEDDRYDIAVIKCRERVRLAEQPMDGI